MDKEIHQSFNEFSLPTVYHLAALPFNKKKKANTRQGWVKNILELILSI